MSAVRAITVIALAVVSMCTAACEPYRVEYRRRPAFYRDAIEGDLPDRVLLDDGTLIIYTDDLPDGATGTVDGGEDATFQMREENEDGEVTIRALLPEHVVANTLTCIRNEEYQLLWDQMVAQRMKDEYDVHGEGFEEFEAYFKAERRELARTLNRMLMGIMRNDVEMNQLEGRVTRLRLRARVAADFKYTSLYCVSEGWGLRLLTIR